MRPHVEIVDERDLIWHPAELPGATGTAEQRNLAYDEEDGSASATLRFVTDWSRPAGTHDAETEWFVLSGSVTVGDEVLTEGGYWMAPTGVWTPPLTVSGGTVTGSTGIIDVNGNLLLSSGTITALPGL